MAFLFQIILIVFIFILQTLRQLRKKQKQMSNELKLVTMFQIEEKRFNEDLSVEHYKTLQKLERYAQRSWDLIRETRTRVNQIADNMQRINETTSTRITELDDRIFDLDEMF